MKPENFCYWLNGYVDLVSDVPSQAQWECIKNHLSLVFDKKVDSVESIPKTRQEDLELIAERLKPMVNEPQVWEWTPDRVNKFNQVQPPSFIC